MKLERTPMEMISGTCACLVKLQDVVVDCNMNVICGSSLSSSKWSPSGAVWYGYFQNYFSMFFDYFDGEGRSNFIIVKTKTKLIAGCIIIDLYALQIMESRKTITITEHLWWYYNRGRYKNHYQIKNRYCHIKNSKNR